MGAPGAHQPRPLAGGYGEQDPPCLPSSRGCRHVTTARQRLLMRRSRPGLLLAAPAARWHQPVSRMVSRPLQPTACELPLPERDIHSVVGAWPSAAARLDHRLLDAHAEDGPPWENAVGAQCRGCIVGASGGHQRKVAWTRRPASPRTTDGDNQPGGQERPTGSQTHTWHHTHARTSTHAHERLRNGAGQSMSRLDSPQCATAYRLPCRPADASQSSCAASLPPACAAAPPAASPGIHTHVHTHVHARHTRPRTCTQASMCRFRDVKWLFFLLSPPH